MVVWCVESYLLMSYDRLMGFIISHHIISYQVISSGRLVLCIISNHIMVDWSISSYFTYLISLCLAPLYPTSPHIITTFSRNSKSFKVLCSTYQVPRHVAIIMAFAFKKIDLSHIRYDFTSRVHPSVIRVLRSSEYVPSFTILRMLLFVLFYRILFCSHLFYSTLFCSVLFFFTQLILSFLNYYYIDT